MKFDITRAWKDETYRQTLSAEERNALPANPAGELEIKEHELATIAGGDVGGPGIGAIAGSALGGGGHYGPVPIFPVINNQHLISFTAAGCNVNTFSTNAGAAPVVSLVPVTQTCVFQG